MAFKLRGSDAWGGSSHRKNLQHLVSKTKSDTRNKVLGLCPGTDFPPPVVNICFHPLCLFAHCSHHSHHWCCLKAQNHADVFLLYFHKKNNTFLPLREVREKHPSLLLPPSSDTFFWSQFAEVFLGSTWCFLVIAKILSKIFCCFASRNRSQIP